MRATPKRGQGGLRKGEISIYGKYVDGAFLVEFRSFASDTKAGAMMRVGGTRGIYSPWQLVNYPEGEYIYPSGQRVHEEVAK
jgi:hypothetical protein